MVLWSEVIYSGIREIESSFDALNAAIDAIQAVR
jgi:hypothetical protein